MYITTNRLELIALSADQTALWVENRALLEKELNVIYRAEELEDHFGDVVRQQAVLMKSDPLLAKWEAFWFIVDKKERIVLGSACFKNIPDLSGSIEIGYGIAPEFENKGYMTEAVKALIEWAFQDSSVQSVCAETLKDNLASQRVCQKAGMSFDHETEEGFWWRICK